MSINLFSNPTVNFAPGAGASANGKLIDLCRPAAGDTLGPRIVPVQIDWTASPYNASISNPNVGVRVDVKALGGVNALEAIRSVKIDNTFNDVPIFVQFEDNYDTIVCPPNSIVIAPAFTQSQIAVIYGRGFFTGRSPKTTVQFSNVPQDGLVVLGDIGNHVTANLSYAFMAFAGGGPYAAIGYQVDLGADYPTRLCAIIIVGKRSAAGANPAPASVTIAGTVVPLVASATGTDGGDTRARTIGLYVGIVPVTANLLVTWANPQEYAFASAYVIQGYTRSSVFDFDTGTSTGANAVTVAANIVPGGAAIFCAVYRDTVPKIVWIPDWLGGATTDTQRPSTASYAAPYDLTMMGSLSNMKPDDFIASGTNLACAILVATFI